MPTLVAGSSYHHPLLQSSKEKRETASANTANGTSHNNTVSSSSKNTSSSNLKRRNSALSKSTPVIETSITQSFATKTTLPPTPERPTPVAQKRAAATPLYIRTHRRLPSSTSGNSRPPTADPSTQVKSPTTTRPPASQANLASPLSPALKRKSPARFSSNGVATSTGPPPSLAYRRTNSVDQRVAGALSNGLANLISRSSTPVIPTIRGGGGKQSQTTHESSAEPDLRRNSIEEEMEDVNEDKEEDDTIRGLEYIKRENPTGEKDEDSAMAEADSESGKDVFLNLARSNPPTRPISLNSKALPSESRWSRLASQNRSSLPPNAYLSSSRPQSRHASELRSRATARSVPPMIDVLAESLSREASPRPIATLKREESDKSSSSDRNHTGSNAHTFAITPREHQPSPIQDRSIATMIERDRAERKRETDVNSQAGETASTASTAAASVWDELDDLKSRIRRLELTGRLPASGAGATSSEGRPRTATTLATTISTSPKQPPTVSVVSPPPSTAAQPVNSHPLLQTALIKSQLHVTPEVYRSLEAATKDALSLSTMVGGPASSNPPVAGQSAADRQIRRKVDSLCRSITELCIALLQEPKATNSIASGMPPSSHSNLSIHDMSSFPRSRPGTRDGDGRDSLTRAEVRSHFLERGGSGRDSVMSERKPLPKFENNGRRGSLAQLTQPALATFNLAQSHSQPSLNERRGPVPAADGNSSLAATKLARASMLRREASVSAGRASVRDDLIEEADMRGLRAPSRAATDVFNRGHQHLRDTEEVRRPSLLHKREYTSSTLTPSNASSHVHRRSPLHHLHNEESSSTTGSSGIVNSTRRRLLTRSMIESTASLSSPTTANAIGRRYLDEYPQEMEIDDHIYSSSAERYRRGDSFLGTAEKRKKTFAVTGTSSRLGQDYGMEDRELSISSREGGRFLRRRVE